MSKYLNILFLRLSMAEFNKKMQEFVDKIRIFGLRFYMWPYWFYYQNKRFKESYWPAYKRADNKKPVLQILWELIKMFVRWRCLPYHYFRYGLYKKDFNKKEIWNFIPESVIFYRILPRINRNNVLLDNKILFERIIGRSGLNFPSTIIKIEKNMVLDKDDSPINSLEKLNKVINTIKSDKIFIKPSDCGSGGKGIFSLYREGNKFINSKNQKFSLDYLNSLASKGEWIIQEGLENYGMLKELSPNSLNSFRMMTYFDKKPIVIYAILKAGNKNAETDNAHTGGIYIGVNIKTHTLMNKAFDEDLNEFEIHPLTKFDFRNKKINCFEEVIDTAKKAAILFPSLKFIGWDIALTKKGAFILEGNSSPGLTIIQRTNRGMKEFYNLIK